MSLKSIELQIAIPRTNEASNIQQQLHQRPTTDQMLLNEQTAKLTESNRKKSEKIDETAESRIRDQEQRSGSQHNQHAKGQKQDNQEQLTDYPAKPAKHPYKGNHIDYSC
ncbi:hypothetical protein [Paenibacillus sp. 481]|uniref:hypothetical protein n=1 Tax=Paenibacillus sp. 481 TaxID=2835869 RepID=UPI001E3D42E9|nr:hypothetical protein [Paenibacillus sp. 481]UHA73911.1 hypothetical protein KIK04_01730 [Paenibacillus sp. 481]